MANGDTFGRGLSTLGGNLTLGGDHVLDASAPSRGRTSGDVGGPSPGQWAKGGRGRYLTLGGAVQGGLGGPCPGQWAKGGRGRYLTLGGAV